MKKRCTSSACRRVFRVPKAPAAVVCPHCGRVYAQGAPAQMQVELCGVLPGMKISLVKALRQHFGCSLWEAKVCAESLDHTPVILNPMSPEEAQAEASRWQQAGGVTRLVKQYPARPS